MTDLDRVLDKLEDIREDVTATRETMVIHIAKAEVTWTGFEAQLTRIDGRLESGGERMEGLSKRVGSLERARSRLKGWLAGMAAGGGALGYLANKLQGVLGTS